MKLNLYALDSVFCQSVRNLLIHLRGKIRALPPLILKQFRIAARCADYGIQIQIRCRQRIVYEILIETCLYLASSCCGIPSGFRWWEEYFGGLQDRVYYIVSGPPGCFKTTLIRNIAEHVAGQQGLRVDFLTLEQSAGQILATMAARLAACSVGALQSGRSAELLARWKDATATVAKWPVFITDESQTDETLWAWARQAKSKGSRLLILDYLQFVRSSDPRCSEEQRVSRASQACREIAFDMSIPLIAVSSESNEGKLRYSGQVEYDAWCWVRMRKNEDSYGNVTGSAIAIRKNRFGPQVPEWTMPYNLGAMQEIDAPPARESERDNDEA